MVMEKSAIRITILSLMLREFGAFIDISSKNPNNIPANLLFWSAANHGI